MGNEKPDGQVFHTRNPTFMSCLLAVQRVAPGITDERPVKVLWTTIVNTWFSSLTSTLAIKSLGSSSNNEPDDSTVIELSHVSGAYEGPIPLQARQVLIVECKAGSCDTPSEWSSAVKQLDDYMRRNVGVRASHCIFAAVAIGSKVILFEWTEVQPRSLRPVHPGTLDLRQPADRVALETALDLVRSRACGLQDYLTLMNLN